MFETVVVVSNNYSPGFASAKWLQLLEQLRAFTSRAPFAGAHIVEVQGSCWSDVRAALPKTGGRALWVSSGSDRDPDEEGALAVQTTAKQLSALGWPSLLICWSFECYLWRTGVQPAAQVVRQVSFRRPTNTFHTWRGVRVTASHRFAAPATDLLSARLAELGASDEEFYSRAGHRVLASLEVGAYVSATQFHPECGPADVLRGLLLELTATWRYRELLEDFSLRRGGDRAPHLPWQLAERCDAGQKCAPLRLDVFVRPRQSAAPARISDVLRLSLRFLRALSRASWPAGAGPGVLAPWSGRRVRMFLSGGASARCLPRSRWPGPAELNAGFQPSDTAVLFCLRDEAMEQVVCHELAHVFLQDRSPTARAFTGGVLQELQDSPLGRQIGPVVRPLEAYCEALVNCVCQATCLAGLRAYLWDVCRALAAADPEGYRNQRTPVFSYFFLRLALLEQLSRSSGGVEQLVTLGPSTARLVAARALKLLRAAAQAPQPRPKRSLLLSPPPRALLDRYS